MATEPQEFQAEIEQVKSHDASDPKQVQGQKAKAGRHRKKMLEYWAGIMSVEPGRELVYRLLLACDINKTTFNSAESDRDLAFREGRRYIGLQILADIKRANFDFWVQMEKEAVDKKWDPLYPLDGLD